MHSIYVGGVAVHVSYLAESLTNKGHEVHIFTRIAQGQAPYECINGVHYHRCGFDLNSNFVDEIHNMCRSFVDCVFATEDYIGPFDVVHAHDWLAAKALVWIKEGRGRKSIFTIHSTEYGRCGNNFASKSSDRVSHIEWEAMYVADRVISVSKTLRDEVCWLYSVPEDKTSVVYNGVNCTEFDGWIDSLAVRQMYEIGANDPLVLFAGRLVYQKGPDILMQSIPQVLKRYPNAKFIFGGDGGMRQEMEDMAWRMGVRDSTRFLGHINGWRFEGSF